MHGVGDEWGVGPGIGVFSGGGVCAGAVGHGSAPASRFTISKHGMVAIACELATTFDAEALLGMAAIAPTVKQTATSAINARLIRLFKGFSLRNALPPLRRLASKGISLCAG
jgi:hypothetical protein